MLRALVLKVHLWGICAALGTILLDGNRSRLPVARLTALLCDVKLSLGCACAVKWFACEFDVKRFLFRLIQNQITARGVKYLSEALKENTAIKEVW